MKIEPKKDRGIEDAKPTFLENEVNSYTPINIDWLPDWKDQSSYNFDPAQASPEQWAWEFLRRNRRYQREIDEPSESDDWATDLEPDFIHQWGLAEYKPYYSNFQVATMREIAGMSKQSPRWAVMQPAKIIDSTQGPRQHKKSAIHSIELLNGQLVLIYDLNLALLDKKFLKIQHENSLQLLELAYSRLIRRKEKRNPVRDRSVPKLMTYLRVADAIASKDRPSRAVIGELLFKAKQILPESDGKGYGPMDFSRGIQELMKAAYELIYEGGYLQLLAVGKKASTKSVVRSQSKSDVIANK